VRKFLREFLSFLRAEKTGWLGALAVVLALLVALFLLAAFGGVLAPFIYRQF
jgi:uncharacterized membrane protein